jgi:hypothetical protein
LVCSAYKANICVIVAKIFYCGGSFGRLGVLLAVMPLSNLKPLMFEEILGYVGQFFPAEKEKSSAQIVIEIVPDEEDESWKAGFYLIHGLLVQKRTARNSAEALQTLWRPILRLYN